MDWKTFFADIISTIAWPVVVMFIIWQLKDKVADLLPRLKKFKYKDTELEFIETIEKLSEEIEETSESIEEVNHNVSEEIVKSKHMLYTLANVSSRSAIIEAYRLLEVEAIKAVEKTYPKASEGLIRNPIQLLKMLKSKILNDVQCFQFRELKMLRNSAVHHEDFSLTGKPINTYIDIALSLTAALEKYNKS